jgi:hypothetical protein
MTRRMIDDPTRPLCPTCQLPMRHNGHSRNGHQQWDCWWCREEKAAKRDSTDTALPLPAHLQAPVVRCKIGGCGRRGALTECTYWDQCHENAVLDLPVMGERSAAVWAGGAMVTV